MKRKIISLITIMLLGVSAFVPIALGAPSFDAFIIDQGATSSQRYLEFTSTALNYSYGRPTGDANRAMYDAFDALIKSGKSITHFKASPDSVATNSNYYSATALAYNYPRTGGSDLTTTIQVTTKGKMITGIARNLNGSAVFEGPIVTNATSSLKLERTNNAKIWNCLATANTSNPIGPIKFVFAKALDKSSSANVTILVNGVAPTTADDELIKGLLFGEFVTRATDSTTNILDGDIQMTYDDLKTALAVYNNGTAVTTVKLTAKYSDGLTTDMTLNIN